MEETDVYSKIGGKSVTIKIGLRQRWRPEKELLTAWNGQRRLPGGGELTLMDEPRGGQLGAK